MNGAEVFETMHDITLYNSHNKMHFYTWGNSQCCLQKGATSATIINETNKFDLLLFTWENILSIDPRVGPADAEKLKKFLAKELDLKWIIANPKTKLKVISGSSAELSDGINFLYILLNKKKTQVTIVEDKEGNFRIYELVARKQGDGKVGVYTISLRVGDVLLFEEISSPTTNKPEDADPTHRHYVRLSQVTRNLDDLFGIQLVDITWKPQDALPFDLCLEVPRSDIGDSDEDEDIDEGEDIGKTGRIISIARGNVVLGNHGYRLVKSIEPERVEFEFQKYLTEENDEDNGNASVDSSLHHPKIIKVDATEFLGFALPSAIGKRKFRPTLLRKPLTFVGPFDESLPASAALIYDVRKAHPDITLRGEEKTWFPLGDLLKSKEFDNNFVVELENDGTALIRFANFERYQALEDAIVTSDLGGGSDISPFYATYRIGNGVRGNVGAETITRIVVDKPKITFARIRNAAPASGGTEPEDIDLVRQYAPEAFRVQQRAVTADDYADILKRHPEVQKAFATIRWTGSWYTVFVAVDRFGGKQVDADFKKNIYDYLNRYRLACYDLEVKEPIYVPLHILLDVCIRPNYFPGNIKKKLLDVFSSYDNSDGSRGFFHPDNLSFGQPVFLSKIYQAAMSVDGISSCTIEIFQRLGKIPNGEIGKGMIEMGYYEIACLDNDPDFAENGKIEFTFGGIEVPVKELEQWKL